MEIPASLTAAFPPSPDALLELTRIQINNDMLMEIARADYGMGASEIYEELLQIRDRGVIPSPLPYWLHEVLNFTQLWNADSPRQPPVWLGPEGLRRYWINIFACAVLLRASVDSQYGDADDNTRLAQALASAKILGDEISLAAARFLTWGFSKLTYDYNFTHLSWHLAVLILAIRLRAGRFTDSQLIEISQWVLDAEAKYLHDCPVYVADPPPTNFGVQSGYWTPLVAELKTAAEQFSDERLRTNLQLCAMMMES